MARVVESGDGLRELVPPPTQVVADKAADHIVLHCRRAFSRSALRDSATWPRKRPSPRPGRWSAAGTPP